MKQIANAEIGDCQCQYRAPDSAEKDTQDALPFGSHCCQCAACRAGDEADGGRPVRIENAWPHLRNMAGFEGDNRSVGTVSQVPRRFINDRRCVAAEADRLVAKNRPAPFSHLRIQQEHESCANACSEDTQT